MLAPHPDPDPDGHHGWSSTAMAARYQHVLVTIRKGVADQVGGLLWEAPDDDQDDGQNDE